MDLTLLWYLVAVLLALIGLAGTVLPALPGVPLVFAGMLLAAWADGFERVGLATLAVLGVLTVVSLVVDLWASAIGARRVGASGLALAGAVIGTVVGLFFGLVGVFLGPFAGAVIGELAHLRRVDRRGLDQAARVGVGTWVGIVIAVGLKLTLSFAMIGIFALVWLLG